MSGLEVVGGISAVLAILEVMIKIYKVTDNAAGLRKAYRVVNTQLPAVLSTLKDANAYLKTAK